jgi:hypothetical protein
MAFYTASNYNSEAGEHWKWESMSIGNRSKDIDNMGETHEHGTYFCPADISYAIYIQLDLPVSKYSKFTGTIVLPDQSKNLTEKTFIEVYADNTLLDTIKDYSAGFVPYSFSYDLSSANRLSFEFKTDNQYLQEKDFGLVDAKLYY